MNEKKFPVYDSGNLADPNHPRPAPPLPSQPPESTLAVALREGQVLAEVPLEDGRCLRLIRLPDGAFALADFRHIPAGILGTSIIREWSLPPRFYGVVIGGKGNLYKLSQAFSETVGAIGPTKGGG